MATAISDSIPGSIPTDVFVDWAKPKRVKGKTPKGHGVVDMTARKATKMSLDELRSRYPPPRRLFVEGIPRIHWDNLIDLGYVVFYTNTRSLAAIRRGSALATNTVGCSAPTIPVAAVGSEDPTNAAAAPANGGDIPEEDDSTKSDSADPMTMRKFAAQIKWYQAVRTEPVVVRAIELLKSHRLLTAMVKIRKQYEASDSYMDRTVINGISEVLGEQLNALVTQIKKFCKEIGLHDFHDEEYGLASGCLTMVAALSKGPWNFGASSWRHLNGCTAAAWDAEHAQRRGGGSDGMLKSLVHGAIQVYLVERSPYRVAYDEAKARMTLTIKHGKKGHGNFKVTPHAKAVNRAIVTPVIDRLREIIIEWYFKSPTGSGSSANTAPFPTSGDL
jgi:hypothetical protein